MFYYKQIENDKLISVHSASIHVENLRTGFYEISEEEYQVVKSELNREAEEANAAYEAEHADDVPYEQVASELVEVLS